MSQCGFVDLVLIFGGVGARGMLDRGAPAQVGHFFRTRYSGGRGKPSPLRGKILTPRSPSTAIRMLEEMNHAF
jgi:hypothetical protein